jgi:hypothetical protein
MMNNDQQKKNFRERVLESIKENKVEVYSKAHFTFRIILLAIVAVLTLAISVSILNFIFFSVRISGRGALLDFGSQGFWFFLQVFPWLPLVFDVALIAVLEWLVRKFRFGYRRSVLYVFLALFAVIVSLSIFLSQGTGLNDALFQQGGPGQPPGPFGALYDYARRPPQNGDMCQCTITAINGDTLTANDVNTPTLTTLTIIVPPGYLATSSLKIGDTVFVAGDRIGSTTIRALGIGSLPPGGPPPPGQ